MLQDATKCYKKIANIFECFECDYKCFKNSEWDRHLLTRKHQNATKMLHIVSPNDTMVYECSCGQTYKHHSSLYRHKRICKNQENNNDTVLPCIKEEKFIELLQQNKDYQNVIIEQNKMIMELAKNNNVTNNNTINNNCHNKTFNLQVFLNETCKDAMNIKEFINSLQISLDDLERVGEEGFVEGISSIFINGLKKLDVCKRPIHCSDLKRDTMYLKQDNIWKKDNDNMDCLKKVVWLVADKNQMKIFDWKEAHPDYKDSDSKTNDKYLQIVIQCTGGKNNAEDDILYTKIIKNIAKVVTIDKNCFRD